MNNLMIDLETTAVSPDAGILSIGAVLFDKKDLGERYYANVRLERGVNDVVEDSTLRWWLSQSPEAKKRLSDPVPISARSMSGEFMWFLQRTGLIEYRPAKTLQELSLRDAPHSKDYYIWSHGASFDIPILESLFRRLGMENPPWAFRNVRDTRTLFSLGTLTVDREAIVKKEGVVMHDALGDAIVQARMVQNMWEVLGV